MGTPRGNSPSRRFQLVPPSVDLKMPLLGPSIIQNGDETHMVVFASRGLGRGNAVLHEQGGAQWIILGVGDTGQAQKIIGPQMASHFGKRNGSEGE